MTPTFRPYSHAIDYQRVSKFLIANYRPNNQDGNWIEPAWEYMHFHPALDASNLDKIGLWESSGQIVAVVNYESCLGEAFFQFHPDYHHLRLQMLDFAETNLAGISHKDGRRYLCAYVNNNDPDFLSLVKARGYQLDPENTRQMCSYGIPDPFPAIKLPEGFHLTSLAEECDWSKVHRVLWRGFDHGDAVPMNEEEYDGRRRMFDTPKARRDLKIAVKARNGDFVAFSGAFYEPGGKFVYIEPVATDPDFRRMGLGKAAVLECIRRCRDLGATIAYVGNDLPIYRAIGFRIVYLSECWVKFFADAG